jgi:hypothetical protein
MARNRHFTSNGVEMTPAQAKAVVRAMEWAILAHDKANPQDPRPWGQLTAEEQAAESEKARASLWAGEAARLELEAEIERHPVTACHPGRKAA